MRCPTYQQRRRLRPAGQQQRALPHRRNPTGSSGGGNGGASRGKRRDENVVGKEGQEAAQASLAVARVVGPAEDVAPACACVCVSRRDSCMISWDGDAPVRPPFCPS